MLRNITIENFQSIEHASLDLDSWTSIIGESDIGKSAIVRALHCAMTNARGEWFIREGQQATTVVLTLDDETEIVWHKSRKGGGVYSVLRPGSEETYEKTAGEVPGPVLELLRVAVDVQGEWIMPGIQLQHDPPFLLSDTPRRRAQVLGELDGTNIVLQAEALLRSQQRDDQRALASAEKRALDAHERLQTYVGLDDAVEAVQRAEVSEERLQARDRIVVALGQTLAQARTQRHVIARADGVTSAIADLPRAVEHFEERRQRLMRARSLIAWTQDAVSNIERANQALRLFPVLPDVSDLDARGRRVEQGRRLLASWRMAQRQANAPIPSLPDFSGGVDRLVRSNTRVVGLSTRLLAIHEQTRVITGADVALARCHSKIALYQQALGSLAGEICPECGQPLAFPPATP